MEGWVFAMILVKSGPAQCPVKQRKVALALRPTLPLGQVWFEDGKAVPQGEEVDLSNKLGAGRYEVGTANSEDNSS